jgi:hypothetical protein
MRPRSWPRAIRTLASQYVKMALAPESEAMERRRNWSFFIVGDRAWVWRVLYPDGTEASSERSFPTLQECTVDATRHGYVVWKPEEERRRSV